MYARGYYDPEFDLYLKQMLFGNKYIGPYGIFNKFVRLADAFCKRLLIWMYLLIILESCNPFSCVISDSMYPLFKRGDYVFAKGKNKTENEIAFIGFYSVNKSIPIVHRVIELHENETQRLFLSKGDNNNRTDEWLYGTDFHNYSMITDELVGVLPILGYFNVLIRENRRFFTLYIFYIIYTAFH